MKDLYKISMVGIIILFLYIPLSCKKKEDENKIVKSKLSGYVQKGPFINGTTIQMNELNSSLEQTGKVFSTQITDNKGSFEIANIALSSQFVQFLANGYYFNEFTGDISPSLLSLYALSDITDIMTVNVNILTHLEKSRVEYLISKGKAFAEAKDTAQKNVLAIFGFQAQNMDKSEMLDIAVNKEENAILLAISIILQGNRTVGDLTELLANITNDIQQDGKVNDATIQTKLRTTTLLLDLVNIRSNLLKRYQVLGINTTIPGFEKYITDFLSFTGLKPTTSTQAANNITTTGATLNGTVNANDLSTTVTFEYGTTTDYGNTTPATQNPVTGHTNTTISTAITGLNPGTLYHFSVKSVNSLGTVYSNELTFTTLGGVPTAITQAATSITTTGATLNGTVNANDLSTTVTFEYGTTTDYGNTTPATQNPVTGHTNTTISTAITGLNPGTLYHFSVKSVNSLGTVYSNELTFTTLGGVPTAITQAATSITTTSATLNGIVNANLLSTLVTFEWGKTISYGDSINATQSPITGSSALSVSSGITGLSPGTLYHFRIKTKNALGTTFGNDMTFTSLGQTPTATTQAATNITTTGSTLNGTVNANDLSTTVTFEYGTSDTYGNSATVSQSPVTGHTNTTVTAAITELNPGTLYHYRVKSVNSLGTTNGNDLTFTTLGAVPTVSTLAATNIQMKTATINCSVNANYFLTTVTFDCGTTISYADIITPTHSTVTGNSSVNISANITGLLPGTTYHFRVKAANQLGTSLGNDMTFTTLAPISDIEGNIYNIVTIGSQVWMIENLKTTKYLNGNLIGTTTPSTKDISGESTPKYQWAYGGIESNVATYGRLYTWYAVTDSRNVCPSGWHVPTDAEWTILTTYFGGVDVAGGKLKEIGLTHWLSPNTGATDETGFTALPGGYRERNGIYDYIGYFGYWWSSYDSGELYTLQRVISYNKSNVNRIDIVSKKGGLSVRCIKN